MRTTLTTIALLVASLAACGDATYSGDDDVETRDDALGDSDHDGLTDARERELGTDPHRADSDGDGVDDGDEVEARTDPLDASDAPAPVCQGDDCVDDGNNGGGDEACQADADCAAGEVCLDGLCTVDGQCPDNDADGHCAGEDCDDRDSATHPGAPDTHDGLDNDCDGQVDEDDGAAACASDADCPPDLSCHAGLCLPGDGECPDQDADGFCGASDCDDLDNTVNPGAPEVEDGLDNDCDGQIDEGADVPPACSVDTDCLDGQGCVEGRCADPHNACQADADCPAGELCRDGLCLPDDGQCREGDGDGDGYCTPADCDDNDASIHPNGQEVADGLDNDCDGQIDEGDPASSCAADADCAEGQVCVQGVCQAR